MTNDLLLSLLNDPQQMGHLRNYATHRRRIRPIDDLVQFRQANAANNSLVRLRSRNEAPIILNANRLRFSRLSLFRFLLGHKFL